MLARDGDGYAVDALHPSAAQVLRVAQFFDLALGGGEGFAEVRTWAYLLKFEYVPGFAGVGLAWGELAIVTP